MNIEIEPNPNCQESVQFVFNELSPPRPIKGVLAQVKGQETFCEVVGVSARGEWTQAWAVKITDSGEGFAYLIYGSDWGIRLKPATNGTEGWDLKNTHQWGESFKIYGSPQDIVYA